MDHANSGDHKAPRHCWGCIKRRIVCDRTLPQCTKCLRTGRECPGYAEQKPLQWVQDRKITSKGSKTEMTPMLYGSGSSTGQEHKTWQTSEATRTGGRAKSTELDVYALELLTSRPLEHRNPPPLPRIDPSAFTGTPLLPAGYSLEPSMNLSPIDRTANTNTGFERAQMTHEQYDAVVQRLESTSNTTRETLYDAGPLSGNIPMVYDPQHYGYCEDAVITPSAEPSTLVHQSLNFSNRPAPPQIAHPVLYDETSEIVQSAVYSADNNCGEDQCTNVLSQFSGSYFPGPSSSDQTYPDYTHGSSYMPPDF
jgi:hypothetical protein